MFIQKLNVSGDFVWARSAGSAGTDEGFAVTTDASENVYITGSYDGTVDFDPGPLTFNLTSKGNGDIFVEKLDANGNFVWANSMGGASYEAGMAISSDTVGDVYITGEFEGVADFDPGPATFNLTSKSGQDIFIQKLATNGDFLWAKLIGGGAAWDQARSIVAVPSGDIYVTGIYGDTVDFDPGPATFNITSNGQIDYFVLKLDQDLCAKAELDSTVTVNFNSITSNENGASYQWLDCANDYAEITGATAKTFPVAINGTYAVAIKKGECRDTSRCVSFVLPTGIQEEDWAKEVTVFPNQLQVR